MPRSEECGDCRRPFRSTRDDISLLLLRWVSSSVALLLPLLFLLPTGALSGLPMERRYTPDLLLPLALLLPPEP